jgi:hypothetical protein
MLCLVFCIATIHFHIQGLFAHIFAQTHTLIGVIMACCNVNENVEFLYA